MRAVSELERRLVVSPTNRKTNERFSKGHFRKLAVFPVVGLMMAWDKGLGCFDGRPRVWAVSEVAALGTSASQSLPEPRLEHTSQDPDVGQQEELPCMEPLRFYPRGPPA